MDTRVLALLRDHLDHMRRVTPEGSVYAHAPERLREKDVTMWCAWEAHDVVGCVALKELDPHCGEIKSMHTAESLRRRGVATSLVRHVMAQAIARGYDRLYLETGASDAFSAARALYARHGFEECGPFGGYSDDPHSFFMMKRL